MKKTIYILILVFILSLFSIMAAPPQELFAVSGLTLEIISDEIHEFNTTYPVHLHLYNTETGLPVTNTTANCSYHLYSEQTSFKHLDKGVLSYDAPDFEKYINQTNFTYAGQYSLLIWCQTATQGGFKQIYFDVDDGIQKVGIWTCPTKENYWLPITIILLGIIAIVAALIFGESIFGVLGGVMIICSYFFIGACAPVLFSIVLFIGIIITIRFAFL